MRMKNYAKTRAAKAKLAAAPPRPLTDHPPAL
uniref:Uncharacterized protein n=1 Tax=Triticum urartu TaxID=4572 RepID=A0A8R7UKB6_TRIUA